MMLLLLAAVAHVVAPGVAMIPGQVTPDKGPDGNSIFIDAPDGLILVDTGRHPEHRDKLLAYAKARGRPIVAILNTHWHLDHTTGNGEIRAAHPQAEIFASNAVEGALTGFLKRSREQVDAQAKAGQVPAARQAEVRRFHDLMASPAPLRPTRPVTRSGSVVIGGRRLQFNVAPHAATEADLWVYDPRTRVAIVGDLVVDMVPFMDTACPDGWRKALAVIAATPFTTLVPGHGQPMSRAQFGRWRAAYDGLLECAASTRSNEDCAAGWRRDAAEFVAGKDPAWIDGMTRYYLESRLRAAPAERDRYCRGPA
jgi:glyoxylase-like metal-dependent hydrolase (beta-lactamase superfamily II)